MSTLKETAGGRRQVSTSRQLLKNALLAGAVLFHDLNDPGCEDAQPCVLRHKTHFVPELGGQPLRIFRSRGIDPDVKDPDAQLFYTVLCPDRVKIRCQRNLPRESGSMV